MDKQLLLTCDDAGFASVDRGIRTLVEQTGKPVSAEYMIAQEGAPQRARAIGDLQLVARGLHFELLQLPDSERVELSQRLQREQTSLGEQQYIRAMAENDARMQLKMFQDELGMNPLHISTHGNFNTDSQGNITGWWNDLTHELFEGDVPPMQLQFPHVRHNLYSWNTQEKRRMPRTPEEFGSELRRNIHADVVEFVMHPALPHQSDVSLNMLFTAQMRQRDLFSAIRIIRSGIIERTGFSIVPVSALPRQQHSSRKMVA